EIPQELLASCLELAIINLTTNSRTDVTVFESRKHIIQDTLDEYYRLYNQPNRVKLNEILALLNTYDEQDAAYLEFIKKEGVRESTQKLLTESEELGEKINQ